MSHVGEDVLLEQLVRILENGGCLLEDWSGLFALLTWLFEHMAIILELPVFIRRFYGLLDYFTFY